MSWKSYVIKGNSRRSCKGVINARRGWKRPGKAGIKWNAPAMYYLTYSETCGKVLYQAWNMDFGGNGRKKKGKEGDGSEDTQRRNEKTIAVMSV